MLVGFVGELIGSTRALVGSVGELIDSTGELFGSVGVLVASQETWLVLLEKLRAYIKE